MSALLGLDYGTTSYKAALFDLAGQPLAIAGGELAVSQPMAGWVEQQAEAGWQAVAATVRGLLAQAGVAPEAVTAVAVTGSSHMTLLDEQGRVLRPAILYGDTRVPAPDVVATILSELGAERVAAAFGLADLDEARLTIILRVLRSSKLLWLRTHEPDVYARIRTCLSSSADYLNQRLTGRAAYLAGAVPLEDDLAALFGMPPAWFGAAVGTGAVVGQVTPAAAVETGLAAGTPVVMTGIDSLVAFMGAGLARPGMAVNLAGTTDVVAVTLDQRPMGGPGYPLAHLISGLWLRSLSPVRGPALRWFKAAFLSPGASYAAIDQLAATVPTGAEGLLCLPYLSGEKGVVHDPQARGALVGLDTRHGAAHIARALLEGVAFGLREILEAYAEAGAPASTVRLSGGGARSRLWNQMKADVLGRPVEVLRVREAGCLGAAMLAAVALGVYPDRRAAAQAMASVAEVLAPDPTAAAVYQEVYTLYPQLYPANRGLWPGLARLREAT